MGSKHWRRISQGVTTTHALFLPFLPTRQKVLGSFKEAMRVKQAGFRGSYVKRLYVKEELSRQ